MAEYNGWTNYETWVVNLWIDNDGSSELWRERAQDIYDASEPWSRRGFGLTRAEAATLDLADEIQSQIEEYNPVADEASMYSDLMNAALSEVNWREIASHYVDEASEEVDEDAG